jgi:hypothetical protein
MMKTFNYTPMRIATVVATFVALVSSVGAPFKWS